MLRGFIIGSEFEKWKIEKTWIGFFRKEHEILAIPADVLADLSAMLSEGFRLFIRKCSSNRENNRDPRMVRSGISRI